MNLLPLHSDNSDFSKTERFIKGGLLLLLDYKGCKKEEQGKMSYRIEDKQDFNCKKSISSNANSIGGVF